MRWLRILVMTALGVFLTQTAPAAGSRGGRGGEAAFHSGRAAPAPGFFRPHNRISPGAFTSFGAHEMREGGHHEAEAGRFHRGAHSGLWYPAPWLWSPWSMGAGWDPYWWGWYPAPNMGYYSSAHQGEIKLQTDQKTASVYLNGAYAGTVKELKKIHLRPGAYDLEIRTVDGRVFHDHVYVLAGKTLKIKPTFQPAGTSGSAEGS